ncbi:MAG: photosystem II reaction center protein J [Gemmatimonadaceae bacterium]|nr:photosystem II reaction center protein J [Gloeobacterales cyanobacterium ES-bin-141]
MPDRIPLWMVGVIAGLGVLAILGLFFYGSYVGVGSA